MPIQRPASLRLSAVDTGGVTVLGAGQARAAVRDGSAPTTQFRVGVRQYAWTRGNRQVNTFVYYPATGDPVGAPITNAAVAPGVFPVCGFMHGFSSSPQMSLTVIKPLTAAGFIVPAPYFAHLDISDVYNGNQSRDISEIITRTLALNTGGPLAGHVATTCGIGMSGHSMGGMTTLGLLTQWPDPRITAAIPMSTVTMGDPSSAVHSKILFMHGDRDATCPYASGRKAYGKMPVPKAFLTFRGAGHADYLDDTEVQTTFVDWMRWSLYGDAAARDRLAADASSSHTVWESAR